MNVLDAKFNSTSNGTSFNSQSFGLPNRSQQDLLIVYHYKIANNEFYILQQ